MSDDHIGEFVVRVRARDPMAEQPLTKYHLVDSERGEPDRYVLRCGREMTRIDGTMLVFWAMPPDIDARCAQC